MIIIIVIDSGLVGSSGRGAARAEDAQGTPTQSHTSPSILVYEDDNSNNEQGDYERDDDDGRLRTPQPLTLNPHPSVLNPQPSTPSTLNPHPSSLNPQPSTLNRRVCAVPGAGPRGVPRCRCPHKMTEIIIMIIMIAMMDDNDSNNEQGDYEQ